MWPFGRISVRQREIRRARTERKGAARQRWFTAPKLGWAAISTLAAVIAAMILNIGGEVLPIREGQTLTAAITARVKFDILDAARTAQLREQKRNESPNYYALNAGVVDEVRRRLSSAFTLAKAHLQNPDEFVTEARKVGIRLDPAAVEALRKRAETDASADHTREVETVLARLKLQPLVEAAAGGAVRSATFAVLADPTTGTEPTWAMSQVQFANDAEAVVPAATAAAEAAQPELRAAYRDTIKSALAPSATGPARPLFIYDHERTLLTANRAAEQTPVQMIAYGPGDVVVREGDVNAAELERLRAEREAYRTYMRTQQPVAYYLAVLGRTALAMLIVFGVASYNVRFHQAFTKEPYRGAVSVVLLLIIFAIARGMTLATDTPPQALAGFQAAAAGLLGIVYSHPAVIAICAGLAILLTLSAQQGLGFLILLMAVSATLVFNLREIRNRGRIVQVGSTAAFVALFVSLADNLYSGQPLSLELTMRPSYAFELSLWAAGATLLAAFVVEGTLPFIERLFKLSTGMTLLELCDANKPLLREMAAEAPGTYNHSFLVGSLAEAAAAAIGANSLLCRAGAYYHDIGKINKPEYFVENQTPGINRHDRLTPAMSLLIIIGHVKDGIEMAKEYRLPASLLPFIAEHHGTTLVEYFYHAANRARRPDDPEISQEEYRYPGPKPQSRETAIVMICDSVEGAVRAMTEPTPNRIEAVVSEIVLKRLNDGQFDQCDLTFKQLADIEKSLVKSLCSIYHGRIVYPEAEPARRSAAS